MNVNNPYNNGYFRVWAGAHPEVYTQSWSSECNLGNQYWAYDASTSAYMNDNRTFDIVGDSLTVFFVSESFPETTTNADIKSYGYYMKVSSASLVAEVIYDDDGASFNNQTDLGFLLLSKIASDNGINPNTDIDPTYRILYRRYVS